MTASKSPRILNRRKVNAPTILHEVYTRGGCISETLNTVTWLHAECSSGFSRLDCKIFPSTPTHSLALTTVDMLYMCNVNVSLRRSLGKWKREIPPGPPSTYPLVAPYSPRRRNQKTCSVLDRVSYVSHWLSRSRSISRNQWSEFFLRIAGNKVANSSSNLEGLLGFTSNARLALKHMELYEIARPRLSRMLLVSSYV